MSAPPSVRGDDTPTAVSDHDLPNKSEKNPGSGDSGKTKRADGKIELTDEDCADKLGFAFSTRKKWTILSVIFAVQVSMNFNTSIYPNAVAPLAAHFAISEQAARVGQMLFLVAYAFGSELWAPWSEELGRWPVLQLSLCLVNIWQLPCALAPNFGTIAAARFLGGLSSAGGSVTLGMVADMWAEDDQQHAVAFIVLSSVGGSALGPIVGGFAQTHLSWRWIFWIQLILGGGVQALHFVLVPETRATVLVDREARRRRRADPAANVWGPNELKANRFSKKEILLTWARPFEMFAREPIVLWLSLLSGFSDALIFTFLEGFTPVFAQWGFSVAQTGLAFIPIVVGYVLAYLSFFPVIRRHRAVRRRDPHALQPEARLWWLLYTAPLEALGLFGFAWTSLGPPIPWIVPLVFAAMIAVANGSCGNALARDFLAGIAAMYSTPMYANIGKAHPLEWASTVLACLAVLVTAPIYVFYWKGPQIRARSKFAQTLESDRQARGGRRVEGVGEKARADRIERLEEA
ncbi:hypothetical protein HWV62_30065 [Athelia sp. TMB]|nr:hypothetical protein HWV62_30065 [Athelia sp. TMB]